MDSYNFIDGVFVYFVTFTTIDWLAVFVTPEPTRIIIDSLRFCIKEKYLRVHGYVIMPNHMHLIVFDSNFDNDRLQKTLTGFRKFTGRKLADYIDFQLAASISRIIRKDNLIDRSRQVWKPGWHAEAIASEEFLHQKMEYIHENPVRKGYVDLPEYWKYSSASFWNNGDIGNIPIALDVGIED